MYGFAMSDNIVRENIRELTKEQSLLCERRVCEIAELAYDAASSSKKMIEDGMGIYEILSFFSEEYDELQVKSHDFHLPENKEILDFEFSRFSIMDKAYFSKIYTELMNKEDTKLCEVDFLPQTALDETFVYVKNTYSDEAYDVFAQDFADPRVRYATSFKEAVNLVENGEVTYCLLPLEERGARLATVAELLYRQELKINSVIPVFGIDGSADLKYAMVSRSFTVAKRDSDDDRYLEIRLPKNGVLSLSQILTVAECYGVNIYRVNSLSFNSNEGRQDCYSIVFSGENVDFTSLLVFLTLFSSDYTAVGIYKNLET